MRIDSVASMRFDPRAFSPINLYLVVKSQDQKERRSRLIDATKKGRIGRFEERPVAEGLVVKGRLDSPRGIFDTSSSSVLKLREPRGLVLLDDGTMLVAEIDRVLHIETSGHVLRSYSLPGFGFLHSIERSADRTKLLVVCSGYDLIAEIDLASGELVWDWLAWEHGFNPNLDGTYLARDPELYEGFTKRGRRARLIDFTQRNAHGLMTTERSNHPNTACYSSVSEPLVLVTLGHSGDLIEIDARSGVWRYVLRGLASMPHGIQRYGDGWMITNTLKGECWFLGRDFAVVGKLLFSDLPGKPAELAGNEWLQSVHPIGPDRLIGLDANRGLILVDFASRAWSAVPVDDNWCVHLALLPAVAAGNLSC
jgi:hypothetical protein